MKKRTLSQKKRTLKDLNIVRKQVELPKQEGATRLCLKCNLAFYSLGNWNRICEGCISLINKREASLEIYSISYR